MTPPSNWTELPATPDGNASCSNLLVRGQLIASAIIGTITPSIPFVLTDPRVAGTTQAGTLSLEGFATPFAASTRMTMRSLTVGNDASVIRWLRNDLAVRFSMGNDSLGTGLNNWWLFDNVVGQYPLYFQSGAPGDTVGSIRWQGGRIAYDTSTDTMTRRVANVVRETFSPALYQLDSGGGLVLSCLGSYQLTAGNSVNCTAAAAAVFQGAGSLVVRSTAADAVFSSGTTLAVSAGSSMTVDAATNLTVNASDTLDLVGAGATPGVTVRATAADVQVTAITGISLDTAAGNVSLKASAGTVKVANAAADVVSIYGGAGAPQTTITGSRATGAALLNLLTFLALRGDIIDGTSA